VFHISIWGTWSFV